MGLTHPNLIDFPWGLMCPSETLLTYPNSLNCFKFNGVWIWKLVIDYYNFISGSHHILQKMVFILSNFVLIAMALYKCNAMGLLPIHPSDWIAFALPKTRMEYVVGGPVLMSWLRFQKIIIMMQWDGFKDLTTILIIWTI